MQQREILFRGKRFDTKEWIYGYYVVNGMGTYNEQHLICTSMTVYKGCQIDALVIPFEVIPGTVGQYTGHRDMHNNRIFEGDVIRYAHDWDYDGGFELNNRVFKTPSKKGRYQPEIGIVEWEGNEYAHFIVTPYRIMLNPFEFLIEAIGTKHDNPELLTQNINTNASTDNI